jgi:hypothetical protein
MNLKPSEYLDLTIRKLNVKNDRQMAMKFGWRDSKVNNYRHNRQAMDNEASRQIAAELEMPVIKVIADMEAFRAEKKNDKTLFEEWTKVSKMAGVANLKLLILLPFLSILIRQYCILC